jgi:polyhydroxybutyrate depolymerase
MITRLSLARPSAAAATAAALCVALAIAVPAPPIHAQSPAGSQSMSHGGYTRTYRMHVPAGRDGSAPLPLVLVLHGGGGTGAQIERLTGFNAVADAQGFVVVYPDGVQRQWNDGRDGERLRARVGGVDDVGFIGALLDHVAGRVRVDPRRVYATGISNGGFMSHRLGMDLSARIAAIAPVAGTLGEAIAARFAPAQPVAVMHLHGTRDAFVKYDGGDVIGRGGVAVSVGRVVDLWVTANGCATPPRTEQLPDRDPADGTRVRRDAYAPCRAGTEVVSYSVEGGGHTWPGRSMPGLGRTTRDIEGAPLIWEFFARHPKR